MLIFVKMSTVFILKQYPVVFDAYQRMCYSFLKGLKELLLFWITVIVILVNITKDRTNS